MSPNPDSTPNSNSNPNPNPSSVPLLPTPKRLTLGTGRTRIGREIVLTLDPVFGELAGIVRSELEHLGVKTIREAAGASNASDASDASNAPNAVSLSVLGRGEMPEPIERELSGQDYPEQSYALLSEAGRLTVYALDRKGALNGIATVHQLIEGASGGEIPDLSIVDGPDIERRIVSPTLTWYAGFARAGFGTQLWDGDRWRVFVDWCFRHKINALNVVMYGFWPFEFPEYSDTTLRDLRMETWSSEIGDWVEVRFTHPNLRKPFLEDLIRYANERGIEVYAYIGMNSYSGGYPVVHPESRSVLSPELVAAGHVNNYDSLCTSREDVRRYLIASVRRIEEIGFDGLVFEESEEVQWFCQCSECQRKYGHLPPNEAKHSVTVELLEEYAKALKPETLIGIRWLREPPIVKDRERLAAWNARLPSRAKLFWAPGLEDDDREFLKWVDVFGPERIWSRNCEGSGFAASLGRIPYLIPDTFPEELRNYAFQHLWNDIAQFQGAVNTKCAAINGYGFEWYGHELYFMATAQFGWDCWRFDRDGFLAHASRHLHGEENGARYERLIRSVPCIHETQICPTLPSFPFMPNKYVGPEGLAYLERSAEAAERALRELDEMERAGLGNAVRRENAEATRIMVRRMKEVAEAGIAFNRFLAERDGEGDRGRMKRHADEALRHAEEDYRIVKEHYFDTKAHDWTGVPIGEYYIPMVVNEYRKTFAASLGDEYAPGDSVPYMVGGESLPWEWLLEWGPKIAAAKPLAAARPNAAPAGTPAGTPAGRSEAP
ncbi:hypothetical protein J19TS2_54870 [Cohnella xylanilytica]|uniref:glycoside hydrolase family 20 zincin-like fold domain-containing protein n=1 Tax=Cohnella xylanilytica TaxID=557555 RepID=UPI001B2E5497|nr:glycoside hydrolase family 20 zincin-like fold domain-containing protein [Cohnella xylanilytica]GIO15932.1 hypothetical protein J19TS2_54870 [Cohnella xylanilytica]